MDTLPRGKKSRERRGTRWRSYVEDLAWSGLGIPQAELPLIAGDWGAWTSQLELLPPKPQMDKRVKGNTPK